MLPFGCVMSYNMLDTQLLLHAQSEGHKKHFAVLRTCEAQLVPRPQQLTLEGTC